MKSPWNQILIPCTHDGGMKLQVQFEYGQYYECQVSVYLELFFCKSQGLRPKFQGFSRSFSRLQGLVHR